MGVRKKAAAAMLPLKLQGIERAKKLGAEVEPNLYIASLPSGLNMVLADKLFYLNAEFTGAVGNATVSESVHIIFDNIEDDETPPNVISNWDSDVCIYGGLERHLPDVTYLNGSNRLSYKRYPVIANEMLILLNAVNGDNKFE